MSQSIPHIFVASSPLHGTGVFTGRDIPAESIIEICPILYIPQKDMEHIKKTILFDYYFEWDKNLKAGAIALGNGSLYNHSYEPNAYYIVDMPARIISIYSNRKILAGEEITFNYNGDKDDKSPLWFDASKEEE